MCGVVDRNRYARLKTRKMPICTMVNWDEAIRWMRNVSVEEAYGNLYTNLQ